MFKPPRRPKHIKRKSATPLEAGGLVRHYHWGFRFSQSLRDAEKAGEFGDFLVLLAPPDFVY